MLISNDLQFCCLKTASLMLSEGLKATEISGAPQRGESATQHNPGLLLWVTTACLASCRLPTALNNALIRLHVLDSVRPKL